MIRAAAFLLAQAVALAGMLAGMLALAPPAAEAAPRRLIIVRHGEKAGPLALCSTGKERARALAAQYLSPSNPRSLIAGDPPAAFLVMTLHTLETARPILAAWGMKPVAPPIAYEPIRNTRPFNARLNKVNQAVVRDLMDNPRWHGKTVVMVWEHFHIASAALEAEFPGEKATLRQLLRLAEIKPWNIVNAPNGRPSLWPGTVPVTWPDSNFNFFWILDYDRPDAEVPARLKVVRQDFAPPYAGLPSNDWGTKEPLPAGSGCT
ncbi:histidine phosphatase family protein [Ancylobacter oerskovii]|uniref:Histidine phosphatase family protein n=1 Tax=Ancylobacter oerskovii TaxID=459519 RepID=A0ABW4YRH4_9HYPH|nr:histidine phosphatase family protein [Ancylobacter oerskovii]MBS7545462.1 histidine phosphatase family protein [Ancylobacter oerskovii]